MSQTPVYLQCASCGFQEMLESILVDRSRCLRCRSIEIRTVPKEDGPPEWWISEAPEESAE